MTKTRSALVPAVSLLALALTPASADAAHDTTPPVLSTPVKAQFVVGSQLTQFTEGPAGRVFFDAPMRLNWRATDNVDTALNYDVWRHPLDDLPERIGNFITETRFDVFGSDYTGQFGGEAIITGNWSVQAYDDSDNSSERAIFGAGLIVTDDDGSRTFGSKANVVSLRYVGNWTTSSCTCFADGGTHHATARKAAAVVTVHVPRAADVRRIALVMDEAPRRGKAQVKVDGDLRATVDTSSAARAHRVVVWAGTLSTGTHKVRLVNLSTASRPRIDLDAVVVN
jgi:hypothetical protein